MKKSFLRAFIKIIASFLILCLFYLIGWIENFQQIITLWIVLIIIDLIYQLFCYLRKKE